MISRRLARDTMGGVPVSILPVAGAGPAGGIVLPLLALLWWIPYRAARAEPGRRAAGGAGLAAGLLRAPG